MVVPLTAHEHVLGAITLAYADPDAARRYRPVDVVVAEDLARRAANAIEHARLYREVRRAVEERDEVLGFVSHDLRNPLHTVSLAASLLLDTEEVRRSANRKWLETIKLATEQMNGLIEDLFQAAQMGAGVFALDPANSTVDRVLADVRDLLEPLAGAAGVRLECEEDEGLPPIWVDFDQVLRVLSNLVGNAVKFTPEGGTVTLRVAGEGDPVRMVRFTVSDTGPGLDAAELGSVFDRYWQGRRGDRRGAGMGLAIAKGIVEAHGGSIRAGNAAGGGAEFSFTLPAAADDA
jgi:signal transduction histidine kinase